MQRRRKASSVFTIWALLMLVPFGLPARLSDQHHPAGWQIVGQVGGPTQAVAVQGDYAYVGVGLRLVVLDLTYPATPTEVGATAPFPYSVEDITLSGTRAYVAAGGAGLRVVDISDPASPIELGAWDSPGYAEGVAVDGSTVYLADGPYGLRMLDIADPTAPTLVGCAYDMNYAFEVAVAGDFAYVAAAGAGLLAVDVSDPAQPVEVGQVDTPGYAYGVAVSGTTAYIADAWGGMHVVDLSVPEAPTLQGTCALPGWALDVAVEGPIAYVAAGESGMRIIDVSNPASPRETSSLREGALARRIDVAGTTAYLADLKDGLLLIDVTVPEEPLQIGRDSSLVEARYVAVDGSYAHVAAGYSGLRVVDVSNPALPREVATYETGTYATGVVISGTVAYVPAYLSGIEPHDLHIVDISDPLKPVRLSTVDTDGVFRGVAVQGQHLYAADEWGLRIIDVSDPSLPEEVGFIKLAFAPYECTNAVAVSGQLAYVANTYGGLAIVDVSDPTQPDWEGTYLPATWLGVAGAVVIDQVAFLATDFDGLRAVDVSNPASPVELGSYDSPGYAVSVSFVGDEVILSDGGGGIQVLNISEPGAPSLVDSYDTGGFAWHATLADSYLYVADSRGGLVILKRDSNQSLAHPSFQHALQQLTNRSIAPVPPAAVSCHTSSTPQSGCLATGTTDCSGIGPLVTTTASDQVGTTSTSSAPGILRTLLTVTSAQDSGPGTLREALSAAQPGDTITFDPEVFDPQDPLIITVLSALPLLDQGQVTLDASEAGVILDGHLLTDSICGLLLGSDDNTVRGLQFVGFNHTALCVDNKHNTIGGDRDQGAAPTGQGNQFGANSEAISLWGDENTVLGNLIGTGVSGQTATPNAVGIAVQGAGNYIGGPSPGERNIISANTFRGVQILGERAQFNVVAGNYIGTDISGQHSLGNLSVGVIMEVQASNNIIGGTTPAERNLISGNIETGVSISDPGSAHNTVIGNWIGTDASGTRSLGNNHGIHLNHCGFNRIGGTRAGEGNCISGNRGAGLALAGYEYTDNLIMGNLIGITSDGTQPLGNSTGIALHVNTQRTFIGGATVRERNVIADNDIGVHIEVAGTGHNWLLGNVIGTDATGAMSWGNNQAGIVVEGYAAHTVIQGNTIARNGEDYFHQAAGVHIANGSHNTLRRNAIYGNLGPGIALTDGGNSLIAAPSILAITETTVSGTAYPGCTVEVFSDDEDEGRIYEGTTSADATGYFAFDKGSLLNGPYLTATATDGEGNTSQFSVPLSIGLRCYLPLIFKR